MKKLIVAIVFGMSACHQQTTHTSKNSLETVAVGRSYEYQFDGRTYKPYFSFLKNGNIKKPVVMVIPEWWGLNDYAKKRADMLAELGYFAVAVDFYGDGKTVDNPADAQQLATPFYQNSALGKKVFDAAKAQLKNYPEADASKIAVIGYCFGGAQALNMARQEPDLRGAVSFHGNLTTGVKPNNNSARILVLNGADDTFVPAEEREKFKREMDSAKIDYRFVDFPGAVHSFTNPAATEIGRKYGMKVAYNADADRKSWEEMKTFLRRIFK